MFTSRLARFCRPLLQPWVLVALGICLNVLAAVTTHYLLAHNNEHIQRIEAEMSRIDTQIDSFWQNHQEIERKREFALLMAVQMNDQTTGQPAIAAQAAYQHTIDLLHTMAEAYKISLPPALQAKQLDPVAISKLIDDVRQQLRDNIDAVYLARLKLQQQREPLEKYSMWLQNVALFMQMMGLILVLSRDLYW